MKKDIINFIKNELKRQNMSQAQLARDTEIHEKTISRILLKKNNNERYIESILEALGYDYVAISDYFELLPKKADQFYLAVTERHYDAAEVIYKEIKTMNEAFSFLMASFFKAENQIIDYIYQEEIKPNERNHEIYIALEQDAVKLSDYWQAIYFDYLGICYQSLGELKIAFASFNKALSFKSPPIVLGMIYYHLGVAYIHVGHYDLAIISSSRAMDIFMRLRNIKRGLACRLNIINIFTRNNHFNQARQEYHYIINQGQDINDYCLVGECYSDLAYLCNKQAKFEEAIEYIKQANLYSRACHDRDHLEELSALLGLRRYEEFDRLYLSAEEKIDKESPAYSELLIIKFKRNKDNSKAYIEHLKNHIRRFETNDDYQRTLEVYDALLAYYQETCNYKAIAHYALEKQNLMTIGYADILIGFLTL